ncbi:MAG TPA: NTP transferase domain-containing protein [Nonomuraea sp.]|nr:NTP transferase domain-containing protein [Nonomuraea sp.]
MTAYGGDVFDAVILAGGRAQRLGGVDKPGLEVGGTTMIANVAAAAREAARVIIVGPPRDIPGAVYVREDPPGAGPIPALRAGLAEVTAPRVALLAGDLPFLAPSHLTALLTHLPAQNAPTTPAPRIRQHEHPSSDSAAPDSAPPPSGGSFTGGPGGGPAWSGGSLTGGSGGGPALSGGNLAGGQGSDPPLSGGSLTGGPGGGPALSGGNLAGGHGSDPPLSGGSLTGGSGGDLALSDGNSTRGPGSGGREGAPSETSSTADPANRPRGVAATVPADRPRGVVAVDAGGREQWLLGVWETAALREALEAYEGRSLRGLLGPLADRRVALPRQAWFDCDTGEDLEEARNERAR